MEGLTIPWNICKILVEQRIPQEIALRFGLGVLAPLRRSNRFIRNLVLWEKGAPSINREILPALHEQKQAVAEGERERGLAFDVALGMGCPVAHPTKAGKEQAQQSSGVQILAEALLHMMQDQANRRASGVSDPLPETSPAYDHSGRELEIVPAHVTAPELLRDAAGFEFALQEAWLKIYPDAMPTIYSIIHNGRHERLARQAELIKAVVAWASFLRAPWGAGMVDLTQAEAQVRAHAEREIAKWNDDDQLIKAHTEAITIVDQDVGPLKPLDDDGDDADGGGGVVVDPGPLPVVSSDGVGAVPARPDADQEAVGAKAPVSADAEAAAAEIVSTTNEPLPPHDDTIHLGELHNAVGGLPEDRSDLKSAPKNPSAVHHSQRDALSELVGKLAGYMEVFRALHTDSRGDIYASETRGSVLKLEMSPGYLKHEVSSLVLMPEHLQPKDQLAFLNFVFVTRTLHNDPFSGLVDLGSAQEFYLASSKQRRFACSGRRAPIANRSLRRTVFLRSIPVHIAPVSYGKGWNWRTSAGSEAGCARSHGHNNSQFASVPGFSRRGIQHSACQLA